MLFPAGEIFNVIVVFFSLSATENQSLKIIQKFSAAAGYQLKGFLPPTIASDIAETYLQLQIRQLAICFDLPWINSRSLIDFFQWWFSA